MHLLAFEITIIYIFFINLNKMETDNSNSYNYPELQRHGSISYRILLEKDREAAMRILIEEFADQQPLSIAFCRQFPQWQNRKQETWGEFWQLYMNESIKNQMSIGFFDINTDKLIGVVTVKDLNYDAPQFQEKILKKYSFLTPVVEIQATMVSQTKPEYQQLLKQKNIILNCLSFAIRKEYMGKQLLHRAVKLAEILGTKKGFRYNYVYASNFRSAQAVIKLGYQKIASYECKEFQLNGVKPFALIEQLHHETSLWLKKL